MFCVVASSSQVKLKRCQTLLAIDYLERGYLPRRHAASCLKDHRSHKMGKATLATVEAFDCLGANVIPEWQPLLVAIPDVVTLVDWNTEALTVLK
jgi:hypothetical protein